LRLDRGGRLACGPIAGVSHARDGPGLTVIAVLFEVTPKPGARDAYLETAARLRPALDAMGGCLFIDRFRSLQRAATLLSFQIWRDEAALVRWRVDSQHHKAQTLGRTRLFADYRLRIAQVIRDESAGQAAWIPQRLGAYNDPASRTPRFVAIAESNTATFAVPATSVESFESIYRPGEFAHLFDLVAPGDVTLTRNADAQRLRICEIERDYGMHERAEAPQFYPPVEKPS
jgi:heme-degrading monooxygenase HmoA